MIEQIKQHLGSADEVLKDIIETIELPPLQSTGNVFHDLMSCILEQQIHYRSSKKTFSKLMAKAELAELSLDNFETLEEKALGGLKLAGKKYETMAGVLDFFQTNEPDWAQMTDSEVQKSLASIKGIGPWTREMILLYTLERPDIFPVGDYHLKQIMQHLYEIDASQPLAHEMKRIAALWEPYRSYGVRYLLAWKASKKTFQ